MVKTPQHPLEKEGERGRLVSPSKTQPDPLFAEYPSLESPPLPFLPAAGS